MDPSVVLSVTDTTPCNVCCRTCACGVRMWAVRVGSETTLRQQQRLQKLQIVVARRPGVFRRRRRRRPSCDGGGGGGGSYSSAPRAGSQTCNSPAREAGEGLRASAPLARLQSRCCDSRREGSEAGLAGVYVGLGGASNAVQLVEAGQPTGGLSVTRARRAIAADLPELAAVDAGPRWMLQLAATRDSMNMS
jgi:hypothetical protein